MSHILKETKNFCLPHPQLTEVSFLPDNVGEHPSKNEPIKVLTDEALFEHCGLRIAFSQRSGGVSEQQYASLNLSSMLDDSLEHVRKNRMLLMNALGIKDEFVQNNLIVPKQVHKTDILSVYSIKDIPKEEKSVDAVLCTAKNVPVLLCFADCVPIIITAPDGSFCVAHAGWRGCLAGIAQKSLEALSSSANVDVKECNIYIGPHIGYCCFETSSDIFKRFAQEYGSDVCTGNECGVRQEKDYKDKKDSKDKEDSCGFDFASKNFDLELEKPHIDLSAVAIASLKRAGANTDRIIDANVCTSCNTHRFFSYRAQNGQAGRHGAFAIRQ